MTETVELLRQQAAGGDPARQADLAGALEQFGVVLFRDGRSAEALPHLSEAVEKRRALAGNGSEESLASLAASIELFRDCHHEAGTGPGAVLAAAQEALAVRYRLAVADPACHAANMRGAALHVESRLRAIGRDGSGAARAAAEAMWWLASSDPAVYASGVGENSGFVRQDLARELAEFGAMLVMTDRTDMAVKVGGQAVAIYRQVEQEGVNTDRLGYARALSLFRSELAALGRHADALSVAEDAVATWRSLVEPGSEECRLQLAEALDQQGMLLGELGRYAEGAASDREALEVLAGSASPAGGLLGTVLTNLSTHFERMGKWPESAEAIRQALQTHREQPEAEQGKNDAVIAATLLRLAKTHLRMQEDQTALPLLKEAADSYRQLAATETGIYEPPSAEALKLLANTSYSLLSYDLFLIPTALTAAAEAAEVFGRLSRLNPAVYTRDHARMLDLVAMCQGDLGQHGEAIASMMNAVQMYMKLATEDPELYRGLAADGLLYLSHLFGATGQPGAALAAAEDQLRIVRRTASPPPDGPEQVVVAVANRAAWLAETGRIREALVGWREAVMACEELPDAPSRRSWLIFMSDQAANCLTDLGEPQQARQAANEADDIRRQVVAEDPIDVAAADTVAEAASRVTSQGGFRRAMELHRQYAELCRRLVLMAPETHALRLAGSLHNLANCCIQCGRRFDAVHALRQAAGIYEREDGHSGKLGATLGAVYHNLGAELGRLGRQAEALQASRDAVRVRRELEPTEQNTANLARSLSNLGAKLSEAGAHQEALEAADESVTLRRRCADRNPALRPELAISLSVFASVRLQAGAELDRAVQAASEAVALFEALTGPAASASAANLRAAREILGRLSGQEPN